MSEISKMGQSIEPPEVSSATALGNKLEAVHSLNYQITAREEMIRNTGNMLIVHEEQKASPTVQNDDSRTPGTNSTTQEDSSSSRFTSGIREVLKQSINEYGVSVCSIANNLKRAPSPDLCVHYKANWVTQEPHKLSRTQQANAVSSITCNGESPIQSQGILAFEPGSSSYVDATHCSPFGSSLGNNYSETERKFKIAGSPIGLPGLEGSGIRENKLKEKGGNAVGDSLDADCNAGAFKRESTDDMQGQGMIIPKLTDVNPIKEKIEGLPSTRQTRATRYSFNEDKRCSLPKKKRNYKASALTGHLNDKLSDNTGESDDDHKELLAAAHSVCSANKNAYSGPFWKEMEGIFAPVTSQDLQFLKQQLLDRAEELNQSQSQTFGDACDSAGITMESREVNNLDQRLVKPIAFGRPNSEKMFNVAPTLFQRVLSAVIDEDEGKDLYNQNERRSKPRCMSDDSHFGSCIQKDYNPNNMDRMESQVEDEIDLPSQKHFPVGGLSKTYQGNDQIDSVFLHPSKFNSPPISPFDCQYQMFSLDDKLSLELQSVDLISETMPLLDDGEESIDQEIKGLQEKLYQQGAEVKNNLRTIEKAIQCEQELERRNIEQSAMDQLVEMAYKRMRGRTSKSARIRKISKQAALAFVKRTLSRCKQFEDSGRSCFSQPSLRDILFYKPLSEKDVKRADRNCLTTVSKEVPKKAKNKAKIPVHRTIQRQNAQSDYLDKGSSGMQQTLTPSSELLSGHGFTLNKQKKELLNQTVGSTSSEAAEIRITDPGQVHRRFSGAKQPLSRPSGVLPTYDFTFDKGNIKILGDIANCSLKAKFTSRQVGDVGETGMENRDQKTDVCRNSASGNVHKLKAEPKKKRPLLRIGLQEMAHSAQLLELKSSVPIANANNQQFLSPANDSQDASRDVRSMKTSQLNGLDPPTNDVFNILAGPEDLNSLLDFDDEILLNHDSAGLDVPMDDLSDVFTFK
ncbi:hypothetical protein ACH5RR_009721 [Cinchona calisaya]|uniref:Uncharacterized protein n=1 Tax=Cinchona calisaya TaxID=153742 RepID=A0ABD3AF67_9GENT